MKHSPTPWILTETPTHVTVRSANNELIFHDDKRLPEVLADANLIAAAPELLEALEALLALNENYSAFGGEIHRDRIDRAWDNARAVLKKARGEK